MTSKHNSILKEFKRVNNGVKVVYAQPMVGEAYSVDGVAVRVTLEDGKWLRVYRVKNGELNWY